MTVPISFASSITTVLRASNLELAILKVKASNKTQQAQQGSVNRAKRPEEETSGFFFIANFLKR